MLKTILTKFSHKRYIHQRIIKKEENMTKVRNEITKLFANSSPKTQCNKEYYVELIHTYPAWKKSFKNLFFWLGNSHSANNPYGHTLAGFFKYENESIKEDYIMNVGVNGPQDPDVIHFINSSSYYLNNQLETREEDIKGNQQNGLLERSYITVVIKVNENEYNALTEYYRELDKNKNIRFRMMFYGLSNTARHYIPSIREKGNCCYWTSKGFHLIGFLKSPSNFPMACFYKLLLNLVFKRTDKLKNGLEYKIICYKGVHHDEYPKGSLLYPFFWLKHGYSKIWHCETLADLIIEPDKINDTEYTLKINKVEKNKETLKWINECYDNLLRVFK